MRRILAFMIVLMLGLPSLAQPATNLQQVNTTSPQSLQNKSFDSTNTLTGVTINSPVLSGTITGTYSFGGNAILLSPTFNSPIFSGTATGTYTLGGTATITAPTITSPTITTPTISSPVFSGTATGTYTLSGAPTLNGASITNATIVQPIMTTGGTFGGTYIGTYTLAGTPTIADNVFRLGGSSDATKKLAFEVDGFTTATTRKVTFPDADLTFPAVAAAGDLPIASSSGVLSKIVVGAAGTVPMSRAADPLKISYVAALTKAIYGLTYANNGTDSLDIAAGGAMDATGAYWLTAAASTKQTQNAWAVGTAAGCLDTGAVGNNDYYLWLIVRSDTGGVDALCSLSSTAPSMPLPYDFKRLIGWYKRLGGIVVLFHTYETEGGGLDFAWDAPTLDINLTNTLTTARRTDAVKVPLTFSVLAHLNVEFDDATATNFAWVYCPDQADTAPSETVAPLGNVRSHVGGLNALFQLRIRTSATGTIAARAIVATVDGYRVSTMGFTWARRN